MTAFTSETKQKLREQILEKRKSFPEAEIQKKSAAILENFFSIKEIHEKKNAAVYVAFNNEVETRPLIEEFWKQGKNVFVPVMEGEHFSFAKLSVFESLSKNKYGIPEPGEKEIIPPEKVDFFVVPGLAFDRQGNRVGWGKGYYDRFFNLNKISALKIGLAFEFQVVERISHKAHDVRMDFVVTEKETININV